MDLLVDTMCGGIVAYCRLCGHDTVFAADEELEADDEIRALVEAEGRILITRNRELGRAVSGALVLEHRDTQRQLEAIAAAGVNLTPTQVPRYCGRCNGSLECVGDDQQLPDYVPAEFAGSIWRCVDCHQHFWKGSHWDRMTETLGEIRQRVSE